MPSRVKGGYKLVGPEGEVSLTDQEMRILLFTFKASNQHGVWTPAHQGVSSAIDAFRSVNPGLYKVDQHG